MDGPCIPTRLGCVDPQATTFDSLSTVNDPNVCQYEVHGCTDVGAPNYNSAATRDDGSCAREGCARSEATNYDPAATFGSASCLFAVDGCTDSCKRHFELEMPLFTRAHAQFLIGLFDALVRRC